MIVVLVLVMMVALAGFGFLSAMSTEYEAARLNGRQARLALLAGWLEGELREVCVQGMGARRAGAVTDPNCKLRQTKNVHPAKSRICVEKGRHAQQNSVKSDESGDFHML